MNRSSKRWIWLAFFPMSGFFIFYILPLSYAAYYSVLDNSISKIYVGLGNYAQVLQNSFFRLSVSNTLELLGISVVLLISFSFSLALFVHSYQMHNGFLHAALLLPFMMPSVAVVPIFELLSLPGSIRLSVYGIFLWKHLGLFTVLFVAVRSSIKQDYYELAKMDGATRLQTLLGITFPIMLPSLGFMAIIAAVYNLRVFKEVYLLYGSYPDKSIYLLQHYVNNQFSKLNYSMMTASGMILVSCLACALLIGYLAYRRCKAK